MTVNDYWTRSNPGRGDLEKLGFPTSTYMSPMRIEEPVSLSKCYEIFDQYKMRRRVLKTIKKNLI